MAQQTISIGSSANDGNGDTLRDAGTKINANFTELYSSSGIALTDFSVGSEGTAAGDGSLAYNNSTGVFTYTPPLLNGLSADGDTDFGANKILFANVYSTEGDLPSASTYHGMFAHVHGTGAAYYAHAGVWVKLADASAVVTTYPAITQLDVTNNGTTSYQFNNQYSGDNPTIYAISGTTIAFDLNVSGHPFLIQTSGGANYDTGLIHIATDGTETTGSSAQGKESGTLYWQIPAATTGNYQYICSIHSGMVGTITIKDISAI